MKQFVYLIQLILTVAFFSSTAFSAVHVVQHGSSSGTINCAAGDIIQFNASMAGEYLITTSDGTVQNWTFVSGGNLVTQHTLVGTETWVNITLRISTGAPPPAQPYTFQPTIVNLEYSCNVNIPDVNFKNWLLSDQTINTNNDGEIQCSEASGYTGILNCSGANVNDLTGIEAFSSITGLYCHSNNLTSLDLSNNTQLTQLSCGFNQLSSLDLSANINLTLVLCYSNQLTSLNLQNCTSLNEIRCFGNLLTSLDVSNCPSLSYLDGYANLLSSLDVSSCPSLSYLDCSSNNITALNLTNNINLEYLYFIDNQLSALDVSANPLLIHLWCNENPITNLNLAQNNELENLNCSNTLIQELDLSQQPNILELRCSDANLSSLNVANGNNLIITKLEAGNNPDLTCVQVDDENYSSTNWIAPNFLFDAGVGFSVDCAAVNGLEEIGNIEINVSPNPTSNSISIKVSNPCAGNITSISGSILKTLELDGEINIDVSSYAPGIYFIHTATGQTVKFIKE